MEKEGKKEEKHERKKEEKQEGNTKSEREREREEPNRIGALLRVVCFGQTLGPFSCFFFLFFFFCLTVLSTKPSHQHVTPTMIAVRH